MIKRECEWMWANEWTNEWENRVSWIQERETRTEHTTLMHFLQTTIDTIFPRCKRAFCTPNPNLNQKRKIKFELHSKLAIRFSFIHSLWIVESLSRKARRNFIGNMKSKICAHFRFHFWIFSCVRMCACVWPHGILCQNRFVCVYEWKTKKKSVVWLFAFSAKY